jgi:hypothetical protein
MPAARDGSDSKQALVVTLVFFILLSIILGVMTYMGFSGQDKLEADKKTAENTAKDAKNNDEMHESEAVVLRAFIGGKEISPADQGKIGASHEKTANANAKDDSFNNLAAVRKLEQVYGWDPQKNLPKSDIAREKTELEKQLKDAKDKLAENTEELKKREGEAKKYREQRDAFEVEYKKKLEELNAKANEDLKRYEQAVAKAREEFGDQSKTINALKEEIDNLKAENAKLLKGKDKDIKDLQTQLAKLEDRKPQYTSLTLDRPKGKIVLMDKTGQMPYINLGSKDRVKPQLTFAVHGVGTDGRPLKESKASLEVVHVVNENLSQCRITSQRDATRDPVSTGDVLMNAAWDPNQKQHVAIAGIVDLIGDLRKDRPADADRALREFIRALENQNIVVDAWLDFTNHSVQGKGISRQTDFLILGDLPEESGSRIAREDDPKVKARDDLRNLATKMQDEATKVGVPRIKLREFLVLTGYRLPRDQSEDNINKLHSSVPAAGSPVKDTTNRPSNGAKKEK